MTSRHRYFIDCIDVLDTRLSPAAATSAPGSGYSSHTDDLLCTLFLFNDRILVAKRDSAEGTGRSIVGLNNINKLVQDMQGKDAALSRSRSPMKGRGKAMRYRGDYDLGEVIANDLGEYGGSVLLRVVARQATDTYNHPLSVGFSLFLDRAPTEFSERWNGRPLRHFVIIKPERPEDKTRFLSNIWHCMAQNKTEKKGPRAMLLRQNQLSVYWNIYDRRSYLSETRKVRSAPIRSAAWAGSISRVSGEADLCCGRRQGWHYSSPQSTTSSLSHNRHLLRRQLPRRFSTRTACASESMYAIY